MLLWQPNKNAQNSTNQPKNRNLMFNPCCFINIHWITLEFIKNYLKSNAKIARWCPRLFTCIALPNIIIYLILMNSFSIKSNTGEAATTQTFLCYKFSIWQLSLSSQICHFSRNIFNFTQKCQIFKFVL